MRAAHAISLVSLLLAPGWVGAQQYVVSTFAGGGPPPSGVTATTASIGNPLDLTVDITGNLYFVSLNCVFRVDAKGTLTRLAGTGAGGYSGDGGPAVNAKLFAPGGIAVDGAGNLYIGDTTNARIRRISPAGIITTVAGNGTAGFSGDGGPAVKAQLLNPVGVAVDGAGNLYIVDAGNHRIRKVSSGGIITTIAGNGAFSSSPPNAPAVLGDGIPATSSSMSTPKGIALDTVGNLYFADTSNQRIRKVSTDGIITTVAGNGSTGYAGDGGQANQAVLNVPYDVTVDGGGQLYIADSTRVRVVSTAGIITTLANPGANTDPTLGVQTVAADSTGSVYIADITSRIRKISIGVMTTMAGTQTPMVSIPTSAPPTSVVFSGPTGVAADPAGNILIADTGGSWLWRVTPGGTIGFLGHPTQPSAVAVDASGNYYAAAQGLVTEAHFTGAVPPAPAVVAGGGSSTADGVSALTAQFISISGIAVDGAGNLFISDLVANKVRKVAPNGIITTVAGSGTQGFSGDGGPASAALLKSPRGLAVDTAGNLYIVDASNFRVRKVSVSGIITTVAGGGPGGDGGQATSAILSFPTGVAVDSVGNIYITDQSLSSVRKVATDGVINTIAGNGKRGYSGDGGFATAAAMNGPTGIAVDRGGNVYVAEQANNIVRVLRPVNTRVLISAVLDAASETAVAVTPGKIVAIYGTGLGPTTLVMNSASGGAFGTQVAGTNVTFNGIAAPMIYTSDGQAAAIVPYGIAGAASASVVVTSQNGVSLPFFVPVSAAAPAFFSQDGTGAGQIASVNLDGSLNDAAHPVKTGGYISLYATGEGQTFPPGVDGALANTVYPKPVLPVSVTVGGVPVTPVYAGAAPTEVSGLMQIVVQIPPDVQPGGYVPVQLQVGINSTASDATWIAVTGN